MTSKIHDGHECWDLPTNAVGKTPSGMRWRHLFIAAGAGSVCGLVLWARGVTLGSSISLLHHAVSPVLFWIAQRTWTDWSWFAAASFLLIVILDVLQCRALPTAETQALPSWFSRRRVALNLMRFLLIAAVGGSVFGWILWLRTVSAGVRIYILRQGVSSVLSGAAQRTWFQWLIDLDLSSFAAAIFLLVVLRFLGYGFDHCVLAPRRAGFWSRAHGRYLFTEEWSRLILRLGLIGTLISFIFAALTLIGEQQESDKIFLLLCAALFGILVGCVFTFVVMPALEKLNAMAMGRHLITIEQQAAPEEQLLLETMVSLNLELVAFARNAHLMNDTLAGAQQIVQATDGATKAIAGVKPQFDALNITLTAMAENVGTVARGLSQVVTKLDATTEKLNASNEGLEKLPAAFTAVLGPIGPALKAWSEVAETTRRTEEELAAVAKGIQQPIGLLAEIARRFQPILQQVALFAVRASEERVDETMHLGQLTNAFATLSQRLESFSKALEKREQEAMTSEQVSKRFYEDVKLKVEAQDRSIAEHSVDLQTVLEKLEDQFAKLGTTLGELKNAQTSQRTALQELRRRTRALAAQVKSALKRAAKPIRAENRRSWVFGLFRNNHSGNHAPTSGSDHTPVKEGQ
jgi:hypothetical protein